MKIIKQEKKLKMNKASNKERDKQRERKNQKRTKIKTESKQETEKGKGERQGETNREEKLIPWYRLNVVVYCSYFMDPNFEFGQNLVWPCEHCTLKQPRPAYTYSPINRHNCVVFRP